MDRLSDEALTTLLNTGVLTTRGRELDSDVVTHFEAMLGLVVDDPLFALFGYQLRGVTVRFSISLQYDGLPAEHVLFIDHLTHWNVRERDIERSSFGTICRKHNLEPSRVWSRIQTALWQSLRHRPATT